tara:strand:- start:18773 stop:22012 length:3240 start_codon:yes stop_codon:yes gene_type:complete
MNGNKAPAFNINAIRSLGYEDTLSDQEVFNDWYDDIATDDQRQQLKDSYSKPIQPILTSPLLQATGPIDYMKDVIGAFAQSAVPTFRAIRTAGETSKEIRQASSSANHINTMYRMSEIEDSPYFGAYDKKTGLRARDDVDYEQFGKDAYDLQNTKIADEVLNNQKVMKADIDNYMENNPKYKAHQEYRAQNPLGFPKNAVEAAEWAGILVPEIVPQILAFRYGGVKGSYAYNYARILGAEIAEDMERNIAAGESVEEAYNKGLVTAAVSTGVQSYFEHMGLPKYLSRISSVKKSKKYFDSLNYKTKKAVFNTIRKVPGMTKKNMRSWAANKWTRVLGGSIKEAATEWTQEFADLTIDANLGYGTGKEVLDYMFYNQEAKQNVIGGLLGGGAARAFYTTPQELRFDFDEIINENSGPAGTNASNIKKQGYKEIDEALSFAEDKIRTQNEDEAVDLFKKSLPTKILSDEDYMGAIIKEMEGVSQRLPIKVNEDKLIKPETDASTAQLIKKNINSPSHKKLLEVYAKMVKDGKSDNTIFDALNIPEGEGRDLILDRIAKQFKRDYGKLDSSKNNPYIRDKFILQDGMDVNTLTEADALALIRATTNDAKKEVIKASINKAFKGKINPKEIEKLVNATYDSYKDKSLEKSIEMKEKKISQGKQQYIETEEGKADKKKEQGAINQNVVVLSKALKPVIIKDPVQAWKDIKALASSPGQHPTIIGVINQLSKSEFNSLVKTVPELIELKNKGIITGKDLAADKKMAASILIGEEIPEVIADDTPPNQRVVVSQKSVDTLEEQMKALKEQLVDYGMESNQDGINTTKEQIAALQAKIDGEKPKVVEGTPSANEAAILRYEADQAAQIAALRAGDIKASKVQNVVQDIISKYNARDKESDEIKAVNKIGKSIYIEINNEASLTIPQKINILQNAVKELNSKLNNIEVESYGLDTYLNSEIMSSNNTISEGSPVDVLGFAIRDKDDGELLEKIKVGTISKKAGIKTEPKPKEKEDPLDELRAKHGPKILSQKEIDALLENEPKSKEANKIIENMKKPVVAKTWKENEVIADPALIDEINDIFDEENCK